jgi:hypothetical protein
LVLGLQLYLMMQLVPAPGEWGGWEGTQHHLRETGS